VAYWNYQINVAAWITLFAVAIIVINVFGTLGYAEEEFWSSVLKLGAIISFMIIGLILGKALIRNNIAIRTDRNSSLWWRTK
jgi:amino acid transporter